MFWSWTSNIGLHKANEDSSLPFQETQFQNSNLSGRYVTNESSRLIDFSIIAIRFWDKKGKISISVCPGNKIFGFSGQFNLTVLIQSQCL